MKIKTSKLIGRTLDLAVAVAAGRFKAEIRDEQHRPGTAITDIGFDEDGNLMVYVPGPVRVRGVIIRDPYTLWAPSRIWEQGGPIIEREEIGTRRNAPCSKGREWEAMPSITAKGAGGCCGYGPTPLIAAMRCYVASRLGDEVDIPEELCE